MGKMRPFAKVFCFGNSRLKESHSIRYYCSKCHQSIKGYNLEQVCDQCGTEFDWGDHEPTIHLNRFVKWD